MIFYFSAVYNNGMKKRKETIYTYEAVFNPNSDGYTVTVPKLPGVVTEGSNLREARIMAKDAIKCYMGALLKDNRLMFPSSHSVRKEKIAIAV